MITTALQATVEGTIRAAIGPMMVNNVRVTEGADYNDNDVLFVTIDLPADVGPLPGELYLHLMKAVSDALLGVGDERVPYLRTSRQGEAEPVEESGVAH